MLNGDEIQPEHCQLENKAGEVTFVLNGSQDICYAVKYLRYTRLIPVSGAAVYINGELLTQPKILQNSNRVILGKNHVFCFINPLQVRPHNHAAGT